jgi:hypothetical protein
LLKLINAGLGRTGTTSLQVALDRLGYGPCYHMFDIFRSEERQKQWEKIVCDGQPPDWEAVFDGYTTIVNGPSSVYYQQMMAAFPGSKILLTIRDPERWYQSTYDTLFQFAVKGREDPPEEGTTRARMLRLTNTLTWDSLFDGRFADKEHAIEVYHNHNQEVMRAIDPDDLLVYDVKQGWQPLCEFLGVDMPSEDFPHVNESKSMRKVLEQSGDGAGPATPDWVGQTARPPSDQTS